MVSLVAAANDDQFHGVQTFECDKDLNELPVDRRQVKNQGVPVRMCFRPYDQSASRIKKIDSFTWEFNHAAGTAQQNVVHNGSDDGATSMLGCKNEGGVCFLDTFLGADFYLNQASVEGYGSAELEIDNDDGTVRIKEVPLQKWIFQAEFKMVMRNGPDGEEMSDEEMQVLREQVSAQHSAELAEAAAASRATLAEL
eukprot:CAMPEP_0117035020 /NCGR_PEP_ID=MMETSP0472-20121206/24897_1 /TAXON_ID=693140 ORGANISM="Tiarina fusus, Strain LIS" /NCGR_SAMPLE_ID=MMETSP0472 /ASSEMBLY_ACC=CAM_ASM_000603 /LENGTH=196 /DNA_ID=CAMNT_0004744365 /DNA_START=120 /DNA_END=710 /DNA_ORIENTATION=-